MYEHFLILAIPELFILGILSHLLLKGIERGNVWASAVWSVVIAGNALILSKLLPQVHRELNLNLLIRFIDRLLKFKRH